MYKFLFTAAGCCMTALCAAQNPVPDFTPPPPVAYETSFPIPPGFSRFTTDPLGNIYFYGKDELKKFDPRGALLHRYSNKQLGTISHVDASNPMRILLYYRDFAHLLFLDDELSPLGSPVSLEALGYDQALLACASQNNGVWLYDEREFQLVRLGSDLRPTHRSGDLRQLLGIPMQPLFLAEHNNRVYLHNAGSGILVFDIFGTYYKTIPLRSPGESFQVLDDHIIYCSAGQRLRAYHLLSFADEEIPLPAGVKEMSSARIESRRLYIAEKESIVLYRMSK